MNAYVKKMFSGLALVVALLAFSSVAQAAGEPERIDVTGTIASVQVTNWYGTRMAAIFTLFIEDSEGNTIQSRPFVIVRGVTVYKRGDELVYLWTVPINGPYLHDRLHVTYTPTDIGYYEIAEEVVTD